jgi:hypothetical protein
MANFMRIFSSEPACPSPRGFTVGRAASRSPACSSRATSNSNFVIDEGSIITDEMILGIISRCCGRGDRIEILSPAVHESLNGIHGCTRTLRKCQIPLAPRAPSIHGTFETCCLQRAMSVIGVILLSGRDRVRIHRSQGLIGRLAYEHRSNRKFAV